MSHQNIPEGYHSVTPYLIFKEPVKAIDFYTKALGAKEILRIDGPNGSIGHAEIQIGNSRIMLAGECPQTQGKSIEALGDCPVSFVVYVDDVDQVGQKATYAGMTVKSPIENKFYGDRMGTFVDPFGYIWHLATHVEDVSMEEMQRRAAEMNSKMPA